MTLTYTEENYIKALFHLYEESNSSVSTNSLADYVKTKPASVNDMVKRLSKKGLVEYEKYKGASLTASGQKIALAVIRKQRLWEVFLYEKLQFNWDELHEVAEQLEHIQSPLLTEKLEKFLNYPKVDPHGDPIPDEYGHVILAPQTTLSGLPINKRAVLSSVRNTDPKLLQFLDKRQIRLGLKFEVLEKEEFDGSIFLRFENGEKTFLSKEIADSLMARTI